MTMPATAVLVALAVGACASSLPSPTMAQTSSGTDITLAPGESRRLSEPDLTLTFEAVTEDSRCPTGVSCVWEGDAAVRIRIEAPGAKDTYTLHTSDRFEREAVHGAIRVRLVSLAPHPTADGPVKAEDYRVTLAVSRQ